MFLSNFAAFTCWIVDVMIWIIAPPHYCSPWGLRVYMAVNMILWHLAPDIFVDYTIHCSHYYSCHEILKWQHPIMNPVHIMLPRFLLTFLSSQLDHKEAALILLLSVYCKLTTEKPWHSLYTASPITTGYHVYWWVVLCLERTTSDASELHTWFIALCLANRPSMIRRPLMASLQELPPTGAHSFDVCTYTKTFE